jgi:hypothetical protein
MKGESDIATSAFVSYTVRLSTTAKTLTVRVDLPWSVADGTEPDLGELGDQLRLLWIIEQVRLHRVGIGKAPSSRAWRLSHSCACSARMAYR